MYIILFAAEIHSLLYCIPVRSKYSFVRFKCIFVRSKYSFHVLSVKIIDSYSLSYLLRLLTISARQGNDLDRSS